MVVKYTLGEKSRNTEKIAIIDFGGQYAHLIARRVRALGLYAEVFEPADPRVAFSGRNTARNNGIKGIILSGGPASVTDRKHHVPAFDLNKAGVPILGICYGHQLIASFFGGRVEKGMKHEYGLATLKFPPRCESLLFSSLLSRKNLKVWMSHADHVSELPEGFSITAFTQNIPVAAMENRRKKIFGVQFHPEVTHTSCGDRILENFLSICSSNRNYRAEEQETRIVNEIKMKAGNRKLLLLLSGGVDSLVALALVTKAAGPENVFPVHIDTGLMRENESQEIISYVRKMGVKNLRFVNAEKLFLDSLADTVDPEEKRARIGALFVKVVEQELEKLGPGEDWMLVQGTIYPDTIESGGTAHSARIKTHHNRVPEIEKLIKAGKVIEPLRDFYKDEVRKLGKALGLPARLLERHPFPGPGLGVRVIARKSSSRRIPDFPFSHIRKLNELLKRFESENLKLAGRILPVRSVGVQGDSRTYRHPVLIWFDNTNRFALPEEKSPVSKNKLWKILKSCAAALTNSLEYTNRVVFSIEPPEPFIPGRLMVEKKALDRLRKVDLAVRNAIARHRLKKIWQVPVIALPLFDSAGKQVFVMRPVLSVDGMTADVFEMDFAFIHEILSEIRKIEGAGHILYDLTTKPPATIEWE